MGKSISKTVKITDMETMLAIGGLEDRGYVFSKVVRRLLRDFRKNGYQFKSEDSVIG